MLAATREAYRIGYRNMDAYTPYPVEGLAEALGVHNTGVPLITLLGGIAGGSIGLGMQVYSAGYDYPLNVGGRPLHSWPAFVPITFELTILGACLGGDLWHARAEWPARVRIIRSSRRRSSRSETRLASISASRRSTLAST